MKDTLTPKQPVIEARGVNLVFQTNDGPVQALKDINLVVNRGEFVSFIGPSGCGKTTFLRAIAAREVPTGGGVDGQWRLAGSGAEGAGLWLCVSGGGAVSVADDCGEYRSTS